MPPAARRRGSGESCGAGESSARSHHNARNRPVTTMLVRRHRCSGTQPGTSMPRSSLAPMLRFQLRINTNLSRASAAAQEGCKSAREHGGRRRWPGSRGRGARPRRRPHVQLPAGAPGLAPAPGRAVRRRTLLTPRAFRRAVVTVRRARAGGSSRTSTPSTCAASTKTRVDTARPKPAPGRWRQLGPCAGARCDTSAGACACGVRVSAPPLPSPSPILSPLLVLLLSLPRTHGAACDQAVQ